MTNEARSAPVRVPTPDGRQVLADPRRHREDVVRRLLLRGVTVATLLRVLPEWDAMIERVGRELRDDARRPAGL